MSQTQTTNAITALSRTISEHEPPMCLVDSSSPTMPSQDLDSNEYTEKAVIHIQPQNKNGTIRRPPPIPIMLTSIESENRYAVKVPQGETLFVGAESSAGWQRMLCGSSRAFTMHLIDITNQEALMMVRRLAPSVGCFVQKIDVYLPSGVFIGCIRQKPTVLIPYFTIENSSGNILFTMEGPKCCSCTMYTDANFQIKEVNASEAVGSIFHRWENLAGSYGLLITFPARNTDPRTKALIMAAAFLLEYMFFEAQKRPKCSCFK
ncbi:phospholipid scramblase 1-like isoform X2 [Nilaparvata lugens]|uniref:phospholipid scramblase 1-like isoform X2 n=1 Tax=Nilaparvata lugens TaxID=108931 RepID=UPI00193DC778|nr:phospholipid scramblase 1-like isoform X2 [Nilaparvata lugens]